MTREVKRILPQKKRGINEWIKRDESISSPRHTIAKGGQREGKWHVLNAFSRDHQFLQLGKMHHKRNIIKIIGG